MSHAGAAAERWGIQRGGGLCGAVLGLQCGLVGQSTERAEGGSAAHRQAPERVLPDRVRGIDACIAARHCAGDLQQWMAQESKAVSHKGWPCSQESGVHLLSVCSGSKEAHLVQADPEAGVEG